ncbi:unnamed protein product [Spirodela intermedia]|uniref:Uncharacterized protein n=1 Tax=Spirodela intermedia TaxID=51605 RepID=A0A7I8IV10_SPIIN|nr:unnamed protein product [Spirodela intermedia]CAA6661648.1 unnamed protein product [Spirodela intermedia]
MSRQIVSGGCHLVERKITILQLSDDYYMTERSWMEVGRVKSFSPICTTILYPTANWPSVMWKQSDAHVPH